MKIHVIKSLGILLKITFIMFLLHISGFVIAGEYKIVKGNELDVCNSYKQNLESQNDIEQPMACDRKISPLFKYFSRQKRVELSVIENIELLKEVEKYLHRRGWKYDIDKDFVNWKRMVLNQAGRGQVGMFIGHVDIDNDGNQDSVLFYNAGVCRVTKFYGTPILVLKGNEKQIDVKKTLYLMQNSADIYNSDPGNWQSSMYSVFQYKGTTYFDRWTDGGSEQGYLRVYRLNKLKDSEICTYKFE